MQTFKETINLIRQDMLVRSEQEQRSLTYYRMFRYLFKSASMPIVLYRWQVFFHQHKLGIVSSLIKLFNNIVFSVKIDSNTKIGPGFQIFHSSYIFIGPNVEIGQNCLMAHQNTVAASPFYDAMGSTRGPAIGDNLLLGCGASIVGDITLGNDVKVTVNSTVDTSFPDNAVLIGVPARNIAKTDN